MEATSNPECVHAWNPNGIRPECWALDIEFMNSSSTWPRIPGRQLVPLADTSSLPASEMPQAPARGGADLDQRS